MSADDPDTTAEDEQPGQKPDREPAPERYRMRRAPKYLSFGVTGLIVGVAAGLILGSLPADPLPTQQTYSGGSELGYFVALFGPIGILLGLGLALLVERRRR